MSTALAEDTEDPALDAMGEAAFFDLDRTVIAKDAMAAFGGPMRRGGLIRRRSLVELGFAQVIYLILGSTEQRLERIRQVALKITKGWSRADVDAIVAGALESVVEPIIYDEAMDLIDEHHQAGRRVVIVSASPSELVRPLGLHLGVDDVIASEAAIDDNGRYTGELAFFCTGREKADAVRLFAAARADRSRSVLRLQRRVHRRAAPRTRRPSRRREPRSRARARRHRARVGDQHVHPAGPTARPGARSGPRGSTETGDRARNRHNRPRTRCRRDRLVDPRPPLGARRRTAPACALNGYRGISRRAAIATQPTSSNKMMSFFMAASS